MDTFFAFLFFGALVALLIGLINPRWVTGGKQNRTRLFVIKAYSSLAILSFILFGINTPSRKNIETQNLAEISSDTLHSDIEVEIDGNTPTNFRDPEVLEVPSDSTEVPVEESNSLSIVAAPIGPSKVEFTVETNIPLPVEVMASIALKGQKPDDVYIGYSEKIRLTESPQVFVIDSSRNGDNLPKDTYIAEVAFYPRWGADDGNPEAKVIGEVISGSTEIDLIGSGESTEVVERRNQLQKWVMLNVNSRDPWNLAEMTERLGSPEQIPSVNRMFKAYYFPQADMTIVFNVNSLEIVFWRMGRTSR